MAINEVTVTGRKFRKLVDEATKLWQRISFWTKASDVEFDDGSTAETKMGAINGITDSLASTSSNVAASAKALSQVNNKLNGCSLEQDGNNFYIVGADAVRKKLGSGDFTITGTLRVSTDWRDNSGSAFKPGYLCNSTVTIVVRDGKVDSIAGNGGTGSMDSFPNNSHYVKTSFTINSIALD